ncbi:Uncharacterised protein [Vibrio cholerae]|nr:Uncharacterised protein [Vibrio cholerae]
MRLLNTRVTLPCLSVEITTVFCACTSPFWVKSKL